MTPQTKVALDLLTRFPNAASLTLARMAYKENPKVFSNQESARKCFRRLRGANGEQSRKETSCKEFYRTPKQPGDPFAKIPEGKTHFDTWGALQVDGPLRVLILADTHIPYHDRDGIVTALRWGKQNGVNAVILNGDTADFFSVSFWEKDPRQRDFAGELETVREFLGTLRSCFPKARIIMKQGNHEERWERYMSVKAPELFGVPDFEAPAMLKLPENGIEWVSEKRPIRLGHLNVMHGHEYRFAIANPVNAARGLFLRCKAYAICGHFHQKSEHSENSVDGKSISTWSTGCLCDLHPDYAPLNNWSIGFAFAEVYSDGKFTVNNFKIAGGKVY